MISGGLALTLWCCTGTKSRQNRAEMLRFAPNKLDWRLRNLLVLQASLQHCSDMTNEQRQTKHTY